MQITYIKKHIIVRKRGNMINDFEDFKKFVLRLTGIDLNAYKERQMKRRIDTLIARNRFDGYNSYCQALQTDSKTLNEFVNYITINVSEFYRNPVLWNTLEQDILPDLISKFGTNLKVWSAACSTGDEPYTLAMMLAKHVPMSQIHIIATDIDSQVLAQAKDGVYGENSLKGLPQEYRNKYFEPIGDKYYKISEQIARCVQFKKADLLKDPYPTGCHLIVCRNVMIYFTEETKEKMCAKFNQSLVQDGCLFVGNTEQIINYRDMGYDFTKLFFYRKVKAAN
jgi:chemotaxis protein methyltransferase CheR